MIEDKKKKVISFKVSADDYDSIKKLMRKEKLSFRAIFEPVAIRQAENYRRGLKYTVVYRKNSDSLYICLSQVQKDLEKAMKSCDFEKKGKSL